MKDILSLRAATLDELFLVAQQHLGPSFTKGRLAAALKRHRVPYWKANMTCMRGGGPKYYNVAATEKLLMTIGKGGHR